MKKAGIICASGIGDGIIMMIAVHHLEKKGYSVTLFHNRMHELKPFFPNCEFLQQPKDNFNEAFSNFDLLILQMDNSPSARELQKMRRTSTIEHLHVLYPTYVKSKYGPLINKDYAFNRKIPMTENVKNALSHILEIPTSKECGFIPPAHLKHKKFKNRIVIHPTSGNPHKNWTKNRYINLAKKLRNIGMQPVIAVSPKERTHWLFLQNFGIDVPLFHKLADFGSYIYESSLVIGNDSMAGHLASLFHIPTLILAGKEEHMNLWRPGWLKGEIIHAPRWMPNIKRLRLKENGWQYFLSTKKVLKRALKIHQSSQNTV